MGITGYEKLGMRPSSQVTDKESSTSNLKINSQKMIITYEPITCYGQGKLHYKKIDQLLNYIDEDKRSLIRARMKVATNRSGIDEAINAIPEDLVNDASLNYERSKWRRIKKSKNYALPLIKEIDMPVENPRGKTTHVA